MLTVYKANFNLEDYLAFFSDRRTPAEGEANTKDRLWAVPLRTTATHNYLERMAPLSAVQGKK